MKWEYEDKSIIDVDRLDSGEDCVIAVVHGSVSDGLLIAAAPELLAALEMIAGMRPCLDDLMSNIDIALAAIAKTKGPAP